MSRILKVALLSLMLACGHAFAADKANAKAPAAGAVAKPLRVVVQVSDSDPARWTLALNNVRNIQKEVGADKVEVEMVAFGPGLGMLKEDAVTAIRVEEAIGAGVKVLACRNTMEAQKLLEKDLVFGVGIVQAGVVEIVRKQSEGWSYLRP